MRPTVPTFPKATAFQWPFPIGSHLYRISPKGSYQLVHHANLLGTFTCILYDLQSLRAYGCGPRHDPKDSLRLKRRGSHPYYG